MKVVYNVLRSRYPMQAVSSDGIILTFKEYQEVYNHLMGLNLDPNYDLVYCYGLKLYGGKTSGDILNIFAIEEYSFLPVEDKEVLDIGGNIGDSSIYFALHGAKKVITVEPDKQSYDNAKKNALINGFSQIITVLHAGCSSHDSVRNKEQPEFLTLGTIMKKYCSSPEILKIDCEGCEYDIMLSTSREELRQFSHIQIEYHYGYRNLKKTLEEYGFQVKFTRPRYFIPINMNRTTNLISKEKTASPSHMYIGWIYAIRN